MLAALALTLLAQVGNPRGPIFSTPALTATSYPAAPSLPTAPSQAFYLAPIGGWGVAGGGNACTGQKLADASRQQITVGRSSVGTCIREADGLGVELVAGEPAVMAMPGAPTHFGVLIEDQGSNKLKHSYQLDNGDWTSTATVTADAWSGPFSHYRATSGFEQISDADAASSKTTCQTFTSSTQTSYAFSCTLRSGTLTTARLSITGTGNAAGDRTCTITGLDATLSRDDRKGCVTAAAYGAGITAVTACIAPGSNNAATGTIGAVDCQLEPQGHITSYNETTTAAVTRLVSSAAWPLAPATLTLSNTAGSCATEMYTSQFDGEASWSHISAAGSGGTPRCPFYFPDTTAKAYDGTNTATQAISSLFNRAVPAVAKWTGSTLSIYVPGTGTGTGSYSGTMFGTSITANSIGIETQTGSMDSIVGNVCMDTTANGCDTQSTLTLVPRMAAIGDSIFANVPVNERIPQAAFRRASINGTNFSHGGDDFATIAVQWATNGDGTYDRILLEGGVNDIIGHDTDGTALEATMQAWVAEWLYRGIKVYWLDVTPFGGYDSTGSRLTARTNFNTAQAAYCATAPVGLQCFAVSSLVWDPANHANLLAANTVDGLHPSQQMADIVSTYIALHYIP